MGQRAVPPLQYTVCAIRPRSTCGISARRNAKGSFYWVVEPFSRRKLPLCLGHPSDCVVDSNLGQEQHKQYSAASWVISRSSLLAVADGRPRAILWPMQHYRYPKKSMNGDLKTGLTCYDSRHAMMNSFGGCNFNSGYRAIGPRAGGMGCRRRLQL